MMIVERRDLQIIHARAVLRLPHGHAVEIVVVVLRIQERNPPVVSAYGPRRILDFDGAQRNASGRKITVAFEAIVYERDDVNEDGEVNTADVTHIYNRFIYGKDYEE